MSNCRISAQKAQAIAHTLEKFVTPVLVKLDQRLDRRLVRTFLVTLQAMVVLRHSAYGLLLSELGSYIISPAHAPAGTKRLSNLVRSKGWGSWLISQFLWQQATDFIQEQQREGQTALVLWDESVVEKPESSTLEGLCAVRSSHAARLKRIKPGFYHPPAGRPVFVAGMQWLTLVVVGMTGYPRLAAMHWWTTRGKFALRPQPSRIQMLQRCAYFWQRQVIHVWDRGFASRAWLQQAFRFQVRFIVRWKQKQQLVDSQGKRAAWQMVRGKRSLDQRLIWDARRHCWRKTGLYFLPVIHADFPTQPLFLVVSRPGQGLKPWYLLTTEPLRTAEDAWQIIFAYARRWQIEMTYRFAKTELALESPRLWAWHNRLKLMMMVSLVYAFLLSLLDTRFEALTAWLLHHWCHRTGQHLRTVALPLYRLRSALARLWLSHPPSFAFAWKNSG